MAQQVTNLTSIYEDEGLIPGLTQWVKGTGVSCRLLMQTEPQGAVVVVLWLWLWCRRAAAAPIQWECPYAAGAALKKRGKKKNPKTTCLAFQ